MKRILGVFGLLCVFLLLLMNTSCGKIKGGGLYNITGNDGGQQGNNGGSSTLSGKYALREEGARGELYLRSSLRLMAILPFIFIQKTRR